MELFIDWISTNWQWVASVGASLIYFILLLIYKRRPYVVDDSAYSDIVRLTIEAENIYGAGHGSEKLDYVLNHVVNDDSLPMCVIKYAYKPLVEKILSTPHKKGGK